MELSLPDPSAAVEFTAPIALAFAAAAMRWVWLLRTVGRAQGVGWFGWPPPASGATLRRVSFSGPSYALHEAPGWARFEVHAAPLVVAVALIGAAWVVQFAVLPAWHAWSSGARGGPAAMLGAAFVGATCLLAAAPSLRDRLVMTVAPGELVVEWREWIGTSRWEVLAPTRVTLEGRDGGLWLEVEHVAGAGGDLAPDQMDLKSAGVRATPTLTDDLIVVSRAFTAVARARRP